MEKPIEFVNKSDNEFFDVSSEEFRVYEWLNGDMLRIESPRYVSVSKSGGHRVFDSFGLSHYIQPGWQHLWWRAREGQPHFVK